MGIDPVTAGIGIALGAASMAVSAAQASSQNRVAASQMRSSYAAAKANDFLNNLANESQIRKLSNQFAQYSKAVDASAAFRNVAGSQASEAIRRASLASALEDVTNIQRTGETQATAIWANAASEINRARSSMQSPWLAGFQGGLQGLQAGLALGSSLNAAGIGGAGAGAGAAGLGSSGSQGASISFGGGGGGSWQPNWNLPQLPG
jgi:hypothetical protein